MTATEKYIDKLTSLKAGQLSLLRKHAEKSLDESVDGFDLFTGIWWPLRRDTPKAPRREVAWLIAKCYAIQPVPNKPGSSLADQLRHCMPRKGEADDRKRFLRKCDELLTTPLNQIEPALHWALDILARNGMTVDWVKLTDDLWKWEQQETRLSWAEQLTK